MSQIRVDQVGQRHVGREVEVGQPTQRVQLFTQNRFEDERPTFAGIGKPDFSAVGSSANGKPDDARAEAEQDTDEVLRVRGRDGTVVEMPRLTEEQYAYVKSVLGQTTTAQGNALVSANAGLAAAAYQDIAAGRANGPYSLETAEAAQIAQTAYFATVGQSNNDDVISQQLTLGMYGVEKNLRDYFEKLQKEQALGTTLRTDISELESALAEWPDDGSTEVFSYHDVTLDDDDNYTVTEHKDVAMNKAQAQALLSKLKGQSESVGQIQDSDLMKLQWMVSKYQQATNVLSNVIKEQHESKRGVIANCKA